MPKLNELQQHSKRTTLYKNLNHAFQPTEILDLLSNTRLLDLNEALDYLSYELQEKLHSKKEVDYREVQKKVICYDGGDQIIGDLIVLWFETSPLGDYTNILNAVSKIGSNHWSVQRNSQIPNIDAHYQQYISWARDTSWSKSNEDLHKNKLKAINFIAHIKEKNPDLWEAIDRLSADFIEECKNHPTSNNYPSLRLASMYNLLLIITKGYNSDTVWEFI